ncbi:MAG: hypothetical protein ACYDDA_03885 [Acidiferrobacteraceae bacterium]
MSNPLPHQSLPGRSLADYTGPWPVPRYWGLRLEEVAVFRRHGIYSRLAWIALALLALPTFWLPNDVLTRHPWLRAFVLEGFGRLFPLIRVADTVGPHGQVMAVMWTVILTGSLGLLLPVAVRRIRYGIVHSDYSLVRWSVHDSLGGYAPLLSGKGRRQSDVAFVLLFGFVGVSMLGSDLQGYLALLQGASPAAAAQARSGFGGLLTGWGYLHGVLGSSFPVVTRTGLYEQELMYGAFAWTVAMVGAEISLLLAHWDTVWAATRIDEQALDTLWATRKRFRFGRRTP